MGNELFQFYYLQRESKKGQVEVTLTQEKSEKKDVSEGKLILSLSRLRCSLQTMHEQETLKGQLYIKMSVVEGGRVTHFWKSDRFPPSVSLKFAQDTARVIADNPYEGALNDVSFVVKFVSKNKMGKTLLLCFCISHSAVTKDNIKFNVLVMQVCIHKLVYKHSRTITVLKKFIYGSLKTSKTLLLLIIYFNFTIK